LEINFDELERFREGISFESYRVLGAHRVEENEAQGIRFTVWAPKAKRVSVVGGFNGWQGNMNPMEKVTEWGIWSRFIPGVEYEALYKYEIEGEDGEVFLKADPYAFYSESRPGTASKVFNLESYNWKKETYLRRRSPTPLSKKPMSIYEVHLGSWRRKKNREFLSYIEFAEELVDYAAHMGYTHIELLPVNEYPLDESWGYQVTGYYSITSRYGTPKDFMYFVDQCHEKGLGVIVDWVPGHFCRDSHGLRRFDGTPQFEPGHPLRSENDQWGTLNFDYSKNEVVSFLISSAHFLFDVFHIDGIRVDAVAYILYHDFCKKDGKWLPNKKGGAENLEAIEFLRRLNETIINNFPNAIVAAEDSTSWKGVTKPISEGGLGFNYKWNMGWMNDMINYMSMDSFFRKNYHKLINFSLIYAFNENFILPLSHDEVVHEKKSMIGKMYGDYWQKFASLRAFYSYMIAHPGKKLLFMGGEFGQFVEWRDYCSLDWHLFDYEMHKKLNDFVRALNYFYKREKSLFELDNSWDGFEWINADDSLHSIISFIRRGEKSGEDLLFVCNFTPIVHENYRIGVPLSCKYREVLNSDSAEYGGSGVVNTDCIWAEEIPWDKQPYSISLRVPPLGSVFLKPAK
jgi:1,4-alpha-glucan branching enzyme